MSRVRSRWLSILCVAIVAVACAAAWVILSGNGDEDVSAGSGERTLSNREQWEKIRRQGIREERKHRFDPDASTAATIGVARDMPPEYLRVARRNLRPEGVLDLRWDDARYVKTPAGVGLWVLRGSGVACIFHAVTAALSCRTAVRAEEDGLALGVYELDASQQPANFAALGIAPPWARAVRARSEGKTVTLSVVDSVYGYQASESITILRFLP